MTANTESAITIDMATLCKQTYEMYVGQQQRLSEETLMDSDATVRSVSKDAEQNRNDSVRLDLHKDAEWLRKKYCDEGLSLTEIGAIVKRNAQTILKQMVKFDIPRRRACGQSGPKSGRWKGGSYRYPANGYVYSYAPGHPRMNRGRVAEHILVAEKMLGRYLHKGESVHHINGIKDDNRPENLRVFEDESRHQQFEDKHNRFAKKLLHGELAPHLKEELQKLFNSIE